MTAPCQTYMVIGLRMDNRFVPYTLEGPRDGSFVCNDTAREALPELARLLAKNGNCVPGSDL